MKYILVTGANGFIGQNLCQKLESLADISVQKYGRENSEKELAEFVAEADFVFHLAAVMRPKDPAEFQDINTDLTKKILALITKSKKKTPILITSSIQAELDNPYGTSKKAAENAVIEWSSQNDIPAYIFRLPNVFGRFSLPNYSSVVATFCYNISHDLPISIDNPDYIMNLAYVDDVISQFISCLEETASSPIAPYYDITSTNTATVQQIADIITNFYELEKTGKPINPHNNFEKFLYFTYTYFKNT